MIKLSINKSLRYENVKLHAESEQLRLPNDFIPYISIFESGYFPHNTISNSIGFFHFTIDNSSITENIETN